MHDARCTMLSPQDGNDASVPSCTRIVKSKATNVLPLLLISLTRTVTVTHLTVINKKMGNVGGATVTLSQICLPHLALHVQFVPPNICYQFQHSLWHLQYCWKTGNAAVTHHNNTTWGNCCSVTQKTLYLCTHHIHTFTWAVVCPIDVGTNNEHCTFPSQRKTLCTRLRHPSITKWFASSIPYTNKTTIHVLQITRSTHVDPIVQ